MTEVAVIGGDYIQGFRALGMAVFVVHTGEEAAETLDDLIRNNYSLIFVAEDFAAHLEDILKKVQSKAYPAIAFIPGSRGSWGLAQERLRKNIKRAIGADISNE